MERHLLLRAADHPGGWFVDPSRETAHVTIDSRPMSVGFGPAEVAISIDDTTADVTDCTSGTVTTIAVTTNTPGSQSC